MIDNIIGNTVAIAFALVLFALVALISVFVYTMFEETELGQMLVERIRDRWEDE